MKKVFFIRIVWRKALKVDLKIEEIRACPTRSTRIYQFQEEIIQVEYTPGTHDFDELEYRRLMLLAVKRQFPRIVDADVMEERPLLGLKSTSKER